MVEHVNVPDTQFTAVGSTNWPRACIGASSVYVCIGMGLANFNACVLRFFLI